MLTVWFPGRSLWIAGAVLAIVMLGGCSVLPAEPSSRAAHSASQARAEVMALPGVLDVDVAGGPDGIPGQNEAHLGVTLVPGYPGDIISLYRYLVEEVWSCTNLDRPTTVIKIFITVGDTPVDLAAAAQASGWTADAGSPGDGISPRDVANTLGAFPGPPPTPPGSLTSVTVVSPGATPSP